MRVHRYKIKWFTILSFLNFFLLNAQQQIKLCNSDFLAQQHNIKGDVQFGVSNLNMNWNTGQEIVIEFLNGTEDQKDNVKKFSAEWLKYANIKFKFIESGESHVRISFGSNCGVSWARMGRRSVQNSSEENMYFCYTDKDTVLHEFGHMLGLFHEHQNVKDRPWRFNLPVMRNALINGQGYTEERIKTNYLNRYGEGTHYTNKSYDPYSIMHYYLPEHWIIGDYTPRINETLSKGDKETIVEMYPFKKLNEDDIDFTNISLIPNFEKNNKKGVLLFVEYAIEGEEDNEHILQTNIKYAAKDLPFGTFDRTLYKQEKEYVPDTNNWSNKISQFIPYDSFGTECGKHVIKLDIALKRRKQKIKAGAYFLRFNNNCAEIENLQVKTKENIFHKGVRGIKVIPKMTIKNAKYAELRFALVYMEPNEYLKDKPLVRLGDYTTSVKVPIPSDYVTIDENEDLFLFLPYSRIADGEIPIKYYFVITQRNTVVAKSKWFYFNP